MPSLRVAVGPEVLVCLGFTFWLMNPGVVQEGPGVETEGLEQQERLGEEMAQ